ncbi:DNA mismatch repair protein [Photobacterium leiognathi]|uniref:DNA mismatch repair protein n=1 Tax=Photobacterium leiognathi TaxID=553611 RepID=UPI001EDECE4E|nr:DNA mismatch repair protein [Photobacterium leiognathi]MCG3883359.1 DNA mismatch repair protein [Photobacterium leiognathi]
MYKQNYLEVVDEADRQNVFISSILYSRAVVFHPADRFTPHMKKRLVEVANKGGISMTNPLETTYVQSYGDKFKIDLHVSYLLQSHRDILDAILSFAQKIQLNDESYDAGLSLSWPQVFETLGDNVSRSDSQSDEVFFDSIIDSDDTVLSISLYDLAKKIGLSPTRDNYNVIENRIVQMSSVFLTASRLNKNDETEDVCMINLIKDFRFVTDRSKHKNKRGDGRSLTNHVFIIPDHRLLQSIREYGHFKRNQQWKMSSYRRAPVRSFIKFLTTNKPDYVRGKKLSWMVNRYMSSFLTPPNRTFKGELIKSISGYAENLAHDFGLSVVDCESGKEQVLLVDQRVDDNWMFDV